MFLKPQKRYALILLLILLLLVPSVSVQAASKKNTWVKVNGYYYYLGKSGKKTTGFTRIGKSYYCFDSYGRQKTGWRKVGNNYRFFTIANGKKGKMVKSKVVNGILLNSRGRAVVNSRNSEKLALMVYYRILADQLTVPSQSLSVKLRSCYDFIKDIPERPVSSSYLYQSDWDVRYAEHTLYNRNGDCYARGCAFAYLANAIGMTNVKCVSNRSPGDDGHGWTEINGRIFDPSFEHHFPSNNYYGLTYQNAPQYNNKSYTKTV